MREWRKLYRGITQSDKMTMVSDGAFVLFVLLIVNQDDAGRYPWNKAKVRALTVTRDWTLDVTYQLRNELVQARLIIARDGCVEIVGGAEKNGAPKNGPDRHKKPMLYEIDTTSDEVSNSNVETDDLLRNMYVLEEKRREEKREEETPPSGGKEETAATAKIEWEAPEWFRPLMDLPGYKRRKHERAREQIAAACAEASVDPGEVVQEFAAYYRTAYISNGWSDPVSSCKGRSLHIAIKTVLEGRRGKNGKREVRDGGDDAAPAGIAPGSAGDGPTRRNPWRDEGFIVNGASDP